MITLAAHPEIFAIAGAFRIVRGAKTEARVIVVEVGASGAVGRGEAVPYPRYGESVENALAEVEAARPALERAADPAEARAWIGAALRPGAARNALDCALWDLEAKLTGVPVWRRAGLPEPRPLLTAYTLSIDSPDAMAGAAAAVAERPILKLKLAGDGADLDRLAAVHGARPTAQLILDANEGLDMARLEALLAVAARSGVILIEQPLPAGRDSALGGLRPPVPLCADESIHTRADLDQVSDRYGAVNIKLDKAGGLTEAIALAVAARARGLAVMVGCMVASSLAMAPAMLLGAEAAFVDLDGPLLLAVDRTPGIAYAGAVMAPAPRSLWG